MQTLKASGVVAIHEAVIAPNELQGMAADKSIDSVLARINNRTNYGMIKDAFELAACYACYISVGHCFNDANKRTAHTAMKVSLRLNGIALNVDHAEMGDMIIAAAQSKVDEIELAHWLRSKAEL